MPAEVDAEIARARALTAAARRLCADAALRAGEQRLPAPEPDDPTSPDAEFRNPEGEPTPATSAGRDR